MISVKDILALLDKIPIWKQLNELPARVTELENRVQALESKKVTKSEICPRCKEDAYMLESSKPNVHFGDTGAQDRLYKCQSCGFEETKMVG